MALVGYSDSENSDAESHSKTESRQEKGIPRRQAFQKVVDRSNPHKILVNFPEQSEPGHAIEEEGAEPLTKKAKLGSSTFSGFNSLLPAPKRSSITCRRLGGSDTRKGGAGTGSSFKTGSTPGFSREKVVEEENNGIGHAMTQEAPFPQMDVSPSTIPSPLSSSELPNSQPILKGNPVMFKPLSVARKTKKKPSKLKDEEIHPTQFESSSTRSPKSKILLFSTGELEAPLKNSQHSNGNYQPLIYEPLRPKPISPEPIIGGGEDVGHHSLISVGQSQDEFVMPSYAGQSLDTVAQDLNLSASTKRQLLGRLGHDHSKVKLINFNTDQEYAANELFRQAGEQVQHNPVRAIAPGKHSLKQLVNAVSSQKDALEEHFATGKRNKKEAGSKYGWS